VQDDASGAPSAYGRIPAQRAATGGKTCKSARIGIACAAKGGERPPPFGRCSRAEDRKRPCDRRKHASDRRPDAGTEQDQGGNDTMGDSAEFEKLVALEARLAAAFDRIANGMSSRGDSPGVARSTQRPGPRPPKPPRRRPRRAPTSLPNGSRAGDPACGGAGGAQPGGRDRLRRGEWRARRHDRP
jgi:hypothetical protein